MRLFCGPAFISTVSTTLAQTENKTESQNMKTKIEVGTWVQMTSENSNWSVGEKGRISFVGSDCVGVYFPERGDTEDDDYTAFYDAFGAI